MTRRHKIFAYAATLTAFTAGSAFANPVCMPQAELRASLIDWYAERPLPDQEGQKEKVWVSDATGSWTIVKARADGTACVVAQGKDWTGDAQVDARLAALQ